MTAAWRTLRLAETDGNVAVGFALMALGAVVWLLGNLFLLVVLGGASRALVMHLLAGERVTAKSIYGNVRARFLKLLLATALIASGASRACSSRSSFGMWRS
jgi:uncharacterized membrane protein